MRQLLVLRKQAAICQHWEYLDLVSHDEIFLLKVVQLLLNLVQFCLVFALTFGLLLVEFHLVAFVHILLILGLHLLLLLFDFVHLALQGLKHLYQVNVGKHIRLYQLSRQAITLQESLKESAVETFSQFAGLLVQIDHLEYDILNVHETYQDDPGTAGEHFLLCALRVDF